MKKGQKLYNDILDKLIDFQETMEQLKKADKQLYEDAKKILDENSIDVDDSPKKLKIHLNQLECLGLIHSLEALLSGEIEGVAIADYKFILDPHPLKTSIVSSRYTTDEDEEDDEDEDEDTND